MPSKKELLRAWLNDAYAMEQSLVTILGNHAKDAEAHPVIRDKINEHIEQTQQHAETVADCVQALGGDTSAVKAGTGQISAVFQNMATSLAQDELIKNALSEFAAENFEIASYSSIIAAAEELEENEIADKCRAILDQEVTMANWLARQIPRITVDFIDQMPKREFA